MEPAEYDEILRTLVRIAARQDLINDDIRTSIQKQRAINECCTAAIERLDVRRPALRRCWPG
jgi:hypothetical protein